MAAALTLADLPGDRRVLVDKSAWVRLRRPAVRELVRPLVAGGRARVFDLSVLEIGYSARSARDLERLLADLATFGRVTATRETFDRAFALQRALAGEGSHRLPVVDVALAAAAEQHHLDVLHYDHDFDVLAGHGAFESCWLAAAGTLS